ncbi:MAG: carbohydrate binding domain-containing protein, partial [Armatimonadota bacterium]
MSLRRIRDLGWVWKRRSVRANRCAVHCLVLVPVLAGLLAYMAGGSWSAASPLQMRLVYMSHNLLVPENVRQVQALMRRAKSAGYNGVVLADYKFQILDRMGPEYRRNVAEVQRTARQLRMQIIPAVCPIGYSEGLLSHDPNLAEGLLVKDALLVVRGNEAHVVPDPAVALRNGGFEEASGSRFAGWEMQDYPGTASFADQEVRHGGRQSIRFEGVGRADPQYGHGRIMQTLRVSPFRQYHLSVWVKTEGFEASENVRCVALGKKGEALSYESWHVKETQDWTQHHTVFNSLRNRQVRLYLGVWEGKGGKLWFDDAELEEVAFLNVLRRPGCPLTVRAEDGTAFEEGKDFLAVRDPRMGTVPWPGAYEVYHEPPVLRLAPGTRIKDGQRLRVSYYHVVTIYDGQVTCCLTEPKVYALLENQIRRVNELLHPTAFMMSHDEIRVANWCSACQRRGISPGQMLADNVSRCVQMIRRANPKALILVWSDMFDPNHNAHGDYYLVNGSWAGSWLGLPK